MQPVQPDPAPAPEPHPRHGSPAPVIPLRSSRPEPRTLTPRERRALELTANGLEVGEISKQMSEAEAEFVSEESVKSYQRSGRAKLGARSLVHAIALAVQRKLIQLDA